MESRIAVICMIVEARIAAEEINRLLNQYGELVVGRMGLPYKARDISIISVVVDGTTDQIGALSGKLGRLSGVRVKTLYSAPFSESKLPDTAAQ